MPHQHILRGTPLPTRRRQLRLWISQGLARAAATLSAPRPRTALQDALRDPHLARDIGRDTEPRNLAQTRYEHLRQRTLL